MSDRIRELREALDSLMWDFRGEEPLMAPGQAEPIVINAARDFLALLESLQDGSAKATMADILNEALGLKGYATVTAAFVDYLVDTVLGVEQ